MVEAVRKSILKIIIQSCGVVLLVAGVCIGQETLEFSQEMLAILKQAQNQMSTLPQTSANSASEAIQRFNSLLSELVISLNKKLTDQIKIFEGHDIRAKIAAIAYDREKNNNAYQEIEETYIKGIARPDTRGLSPPSLQAQHIQEKYRLAWEYYFLLQAINLNRHFVSRAISALALIGNNASILTVLNSYKDSVQENVKLDGRTMRWQRMLIDTLVVFINEQGLNAILECLTLSKLQRMRQGIDTAEWNPEEYVYEILTNETPPFGMGREWRRVIANFPKDGLNPEHATLLERMLQQ
jgi:hypothetical protein